MQRITSRKGLVSSRSLSISCKHPGLLTYPISPYSHMPFATVSYSAHLYGRLLSFSPSSDILRPLSGAVDYNGTLRFRGKSGRTAGFPGGRDGLLPGYDRSGASTAYRNEHRNAPSLPVLLDWRFRVRCHSSLRCKWRYTRYGRVRVGSSASVALRYDFVGEYPFTDHCLDSLLTRIY